MFYLGRVGQSRRERTWRTPRATRHVWVRLRTAHDPQAPTPASKHPHSPPRQGLIVAWRRLSYQWQALVVLVDDPALDGRSGDPVVMQVWVDARDLKPVPADPNRAFGLR